MNFFFWAALLVALLGIVAAGVVWRWVNRENKRSDDWGGLVAGFILFCIVEGIAAFLAICGVIAWLFF